MKGFQQLKMAFLCLLVGSAVHIPALMFGQAKNNLKIQVYNFPAAPNPASSDLIGGNVRDWRSAPVVSINALTVQNTATHVVVPYVVSNIYASAMVNTFMIRDGIPNHYQSETLNENDNSQLRAANFLRADMAGVHQIMIEVCQNSQNCTSVVIIVTVDGTRSHHFASDNN